MSAQLLKTVFWKLLMSDLIVVFLLCLHIREIFRVLDLMKMDMVNLTIDNLRLVLHRQGVEYERATFQSILDKTPSECLPANDPLWCSTMYLFHTENVFLLSQLLWTIRPCGSRQHWRSCSRRWPTQSRPKVRAKWCQGRFRFSTPLYLASLHGTMERAHYRRWEWHEI